MCVIVALSVALYEFDLNGKSERFSLSERKYKCQLV